MIEDSLEEENKKLKRLVGKLQLEANLKKNLGIQVEKQKTALFEAKSEALKKSEELTNLTDRLSKYLSPQIYKQVFSEENSATVTSSRKKLTVFFSDLVGFTDLSDNLESEEISSMLNFYLTEMSNIALEFGGTIDKYIGDAILIFFGDPETQGVQQDAINCVLMAIKMQERMKALNNYWITQFSLKESLKMRIGINTGFCTVGNFGSDIRLDYTVIGGSVNLASRLESVSKPETILISSDTYHQVKNTVKCNQSNLLKLKGIKEEVITYEVDISEINISKNLEYNTPNVYLNLNKDNLSAREITELIDFIQKYKK